MGKVRLTKEQADAIEDLLKQYGDRGILIHEYLYLTGEINNNIEVIKRMNYDTFFGALYVGYEVEPEYSVGDWVRVNWSDRTTINRITDIYSDLVKVDGEQCNKSPSIEIIEVATAEEVSEEKERRWWNKHGRDVWELRKGDVIGINIKTITINEVREDGYIAYFDGLGSDRIYSIDSLKSGGYKIICFAEGRKDV